jgi:hypothetical protein
MKKKIFVLVLISMFIGCSPKMLYPRLDWIIPWYVDDYITLDHNQTFEFSSRLSTQLAWHCRTQLTQYADFLRIIQRDIGIGDQPLTIERLKFYSDQLARYWGELIQRIGPDIIDILASASDKQIAELFENLEKKNRELEKRIIEQPPAKIIQDRQYRMQKRLRYWFSDLTDSQKQAVKEWSKGLQPIGADWIAHRRKTQDLARRLLEDRKTSVDIEAEFLELITNTKKLRSITYQQKINFNTIKTLALLVNLSKLLTVPQKTHLSNRLRSLVAELDQLSCDPTSKASRTELIPDSKAMKRWQNDSVKSS